MAISFVQWAMHLSIETVGGKAVEESYVNRDEEIGDHLGINPVYYRNPEWVDMMGRLLH
jgi:hypothetical protein